MANLNRRDTRHLTDAEVQSVVLLLREGHTQVRVSEILGVAQSSVSRVFQRFRETHGYSRRQGQGRHRATNAVEDRFLTLSARRNRTVTARGLQIALQRVHNSRISDQTVRNRLHEIGLRARRPATGPRLTRAHRVRRLAFAREHVDWTQNQWANVLFSDESRFTLSSNDRRQRVWRTPGTRFHQCNIRQLDAFGGGGVMVWGGINSNARTELHIIENGTLNAERYIRDILEYYVMPFAPFIGADFVFMQDNARPHTARIVQQYLQTVQIETLEWPARSPDLNPIEHMWDALGRRVRSRENVPSTLGELSEALMEEWDNIPDQYVQDLINSMERRCRAVIRARGGNTEY